MSKQCNWLGLTFGRCTLSARWMVLVGCVHEHLLEVPTCEWHVEATKNGHAWCGLCDTAGVRVHKVYVSQRRLSDEGGSE